MVLVRAKYFFLLSLPACSPLARVLLYTLVYSLKAPKFFVNLASYRCFNFWFPFLALYMYMIVVSSEHQRAPTMRAPLFLSICLNQEH